MTVLIVLLPHGTMGWTVQDLLLIFAPCTLVGASDDTGSGWSCLKFHSCLPVDVGGRSVWTSLTGYLCQNTHCED